MKKTLNFGFSFLALVSLLVFNISAAYAGGYCPTWVKTSSSTTVAGVYEAGKSFNISAFDVTAGSDADAEISKITIQKKGTLAWKDISKIYVKDSNGKTYGSVKGLSNSKSVGMQLSSVFVVPKNSTKKLYIYMQTKATSKGGTVTMGVSDFVGSIAGSDMDSDFSNTSLYCSAYGEFSDYVFGTLHAILSGK